ncbi:MAG: hypothetical protein COA42_01110 [Alteromonadaceae bacterium]|nr:MAG: hypothetical protein COA42_01110 [Alteromonadaceae bacterium]
MTSSPKRLSLDGFGLGLKAQHYDLILDQRPAIGWFEVHPENFMGDGGLSHRYLDEIGSHYALSLHAVGVSLGSADGLDTQHLNVLKQLIARYRPARVSEHLSWNRVGGVCLNDLLPMPYTEQSLEIVCDNIDSMQQALGRQILLENPSVYIQFKEQAYSEVDFLAKVVSKTGCGLLLDVNNVEVSSRNCGFDAYQYINHFPCEAVGEIHLAGHVEKILLDDQVICIDDHGSAVKESVWALYRHTMAKIGVPVPVLIEWDTNIPEFSVLFEQAVLACQAMAETLNMLVDERVTEVVASAH